MPEVLLFIDLKNLPQAFQNHLQVLGPIDHFTLAVNLLILIFSSHLPRYGEIKNKNKSCRFAYFTAQTWPFLIYLIAVIFRSN